MALNKNERDLLAIVKHFNSQRKPIAKLVTKLYDGFDLAATSDLTGFTHDEIISLMESNKPKTRKVPRGKFKGRVEASKQEVRVEAPITFRRLAIHINADSDLPQRIAHDMAAYIANELKPGDQWLSRKDAMAKFDCGSASLTIANGILLKHNWIELAEPGNFRKGYVVK